MLDSFLFRFLDFVLGFLRLILLIHLRRVLKTKSHLVLGTIRILGKRDIIRITFLFEKFKVGSKQIVEVILELVDCFRVNQKVKFLQSIQSVIIDAILQDFFLKGPLCYIFIQTLDSFLNDVECIRVITLDNFDVCNLILGKDVNHLVIESVQLI